MAFCGHGFFVTEILPGKALQNSMVAEIKPNEGTPVSHEYDTATRGSHCSSAAARSNCPKKYQNHPNMLRRAIGHWTVNRFLKHAAQISPGPLIGKTTIFCTSTV